MCNAELSLIYLLHYYVFFFLIDDDSLSTIVPLKKENGNISVADKDGIISIFTINEDLWKVTICFSFYKIYCMFSSS